MKILVLTFYFEPDLCAGSFRATSLVNHLQKKDVEIEVLTTLPNRYATFSASAPEFEDRGNVKITRFALPSHKNGMLDQAKVFFTYYSKVRKYVKNSDYDLIFATSSRLFTAFLGAQISRGKNIPLYLDIRDIFVDTIKDVLNPHIAFVIKPFLQLIERYTFTHATHINLVSKGFCEYFNHRYSKKKYSFFTNGIDAEFLSYEFSNTVNVKPKLTVLYAGNVGEGQGLHIILPLLAKTLADKVEFVVVGSGGRIRELENCLRDMNVTNVKLKPPVSRFELLSLYRCSDILFLHLNDYPAFEKVLPSKIFEYVATGKPIWAGVSGFSAEFINREIENAAVFRPGDVPGAVLAFAKLSFSGADRGEFIKRYKRDNIMSEMAENIYEYGSIGPI